MNTETVLFSPVILSVESLSPGICALPKDIHVTESCYIQRIKEIYGLEGT
jgi:hypothetical protein